MKQKTADTEARVFEVDERESCDLMVGTIGQSDGMHHSVYRARHAMKHHFVINHQVDDIERQKSEWRFHLLYTLPY